jgi:hypothetical protein
VRKGTWVDHLARIVGLLGHSTPIFWLGTIVILVFYAKFGLIPGGGRLDVYNEGLVEGPTNSIIDRFDYCRRMGRAARCPASSGSTSHHSRLCRDGLSQPHEPQLHAGTTAPGIRPDGKGKGLGPAAPLSGGMPSATSAFSC